MCSKYILILLAWWAIGCQPGPGGAGTHDDASKATLWLTNPDRSALFQKQDSGLSFTSSGDTSRLIDVNDTETFQTIDGFGFTLTGGSAWLIHRMSAAARAQLLQELFGTDSTHIGISYLRISIGASDLDDHVFSYNDLPPGETDTALAKFDLAPDKKDLIPVLKEILAINPDIKILGSPWSPPAWMKTNDSTRGGSLKPVFYGTYARYLVRYIQSMKSEGITIDAITVQNEPLHPGNNPSLLMLPPDQAAFVRDHLGPAFRNNAISTKILIYDHNADRIDYPISILNDPQARKFIDGSAFHLYAGDISELSKVHEAHPDKNLYFTEQWIGAPGDFPTDLAWHVKTLVIGATRNWCRTVLEWNLAADPKQEPHTDGGCYQCLGGITIDGDTVTRNPAYYIIAHASKFVRPGSVRIGSGMPSHLPNTAFKTPDGSRVLIVLNDSTAAQSFHIRYKTKLLTAHLNGGAAATYVW